VKLDDVSLGRLGQVVLCTIVSLLAAISVMGSFAQGNVKPLLYSCMGVGVLLAWFAFDRYYWPLTIATLFFGGRFSFMPADLSAFQVAMAFGIARFLIDFVAFRKTRLEKGPVIDRLLMAGFFIIFFAHAYDQKLALKVLGSQVWGGRPYVTIGFAFVTYFILLTLPYDRKAWKLFPVFALVPVTFDLFVQLTAMAAPGLAFRLSTFYTGFLTQEMVLGRTEGGRIGSFSSVGLLITVFILASVRIHTLWRPEKWWATFIFFIGFALNVLSGFRSALLGWAILVMGAAVRDLRKAALVIVPLIVVGLLSLVLLQAVMPLPKAVQRGLTFLPGDWDVDVSFDASASVDFRKKIRDRWWDKHFPEHPIFGRGFGYDPVWSNIDDRYQTDDFYEGIIQVGNFHNLKIACLDAVGIVGTLPLFLWCMLALRRIFTVLWNVPLEKQPLILPWISLYLGNVIIANWMPLGGLNVSILLEPFLILYALFLKVATEEGFLVNGQLAASPPPQDPEEKRAVEPAREREPMSAGTGPRRLRHVQK